MKWIPVTERLPENDNVVMVTVHDFAGSFVSTDFYMHGEWYSFPERVTAWAELPQPYMEGEECD